MIFQPDVIRSIHHPFVAHAYIKKEFAHKGMQDVLVIESAASSKKNGEKSETTRLYKDFLTEIDLIADHLHREGHFFDRLDIKFS